MQVDWITTVAQIINFLVLVYLLKRFLYGPIVSAMSQREAHIATRLDEANQQSASAQQRIDEYQEQLRQFELQREQLMEDAKRAAEAQRAQMVDTLRGEIATMRSRWKGEVEREQQAFLAQARKMVGEQVCAVARQALGDLADAELEDRMVNLFLKKSLELSASDKEKLASSAAEKGLMVNTRFVLSEAQKKKITGVIHKQIDPALTVHFEQEPALLCGISLKGTGFKLEWNLDSYLSGIDEQLSSQLAATTPGK